MARGGRIITRIGLSVSASIGAVAITGITGITAVMTGITMETMTDTTDLQTMDITRHQMVTGLRTEEIIHLAGTDLPMETVRPLAHGAMRLLSAARRRRLPAEASHPLQIGQRA
jgi:hypothetical protein